MSNGVNINLVEQIVIPKYNASYTTVLCLKELVSAIKSKTDRTVEIVKDNLEEKATELLVGRTNRTQVLGRSKSDEYIIELSDGKIMIDGGSVKALNRAVNLLTEKVQFEDSIVTGTIFGSCDKECGKAADYKEKLTDDFDAKELDESIWKVWTTDWHAETYKNKDNPNDTIYYLKRHEKNNVLCNGLLNQLVTVGERGMENGVPTQVIYGAKIETSGSFWYRYGYVECSAKIASGDSMGAGFWLHGDCNYIGNHYCEWDISEFYGSPRFHRASPIAWKVVQDENGNRKNKSGWYLALKDGEVAAQKHCFHLEDKESFADAFHTYGLEWDEDYYRFTLDGDVILEVKYTDVTKEVAEKYGYTQEEMIYSYRQPVYAIISIAAGKYNWSTPHFWRDIGADAEDIKNVSNLKTNNWKDDNVYSIDYVTVYQKDGQFNGKTAADVKAQI